MQKTFAAFFSRHEKIAFCLSGGKDSFAAFYAVEEWWKQLDVFWVNTGEPFEELAEKVRAVEPFVKSFTEVRSNVAAWREKEGYPTDILPIRATKAYHRLLTSQPKAQKLVLSTECCDANKLFPLLKLLAVLQPTGIVHGSRRDERFGPTIPSYEKVGGIECLYPVENWRTAQVISFLQRRGVWDDYMNASSDCRRCTGHWSDDRYFNRFWALSRSGNHEDIDFVRRKMWAIQGAISDDLTNFFSEIEDR